MVAPVVAAVAKQVAWQAAVMIANYLRKCNYRCNFDQGQARFDIQDEHGRITHLWLGTVNTVKTKSGKPKKGIQLAARSDTALVYKTDNAEVTQKGIQSSVDKLVGKRKAA